MLNINPGEKVFITIMILAVLVMGRTVLAETVIIEHVLGEVEVKRNSANVIVFDYGILDTLNQMEVEIVGLPKNTLPDYLSEYKEEQYINVGTLFEPNYEEIFRQQPDLILISGRQADVFDNLNNIAPTVYLEVEDGNYLESVARNARALGEIFKQEDFVEQKIKEIEREINSVKMEVEKKEINSLVVMGNDGVITAYGPGSRFDIIYNEMGLAPAIDTIDLSTHGASISFEFILEIDPDYIFVIDRGAVTGSSVAAQQTMDNQLVHQTKAYQNDNIVYLNSEIWYTVAGGLGSTLEMISEIEEALK